MSRTGKTVRERIRDAPIAVRDRIVDSERGQRLIYELRNRRLFADLFQHDRMLADAPRTEAYWTAFAKHLGSGDEVIDLGAGTGVLSMFAAKQGAHVHAIEHGPIIEAAQAVVADNGLEDQIEFHRINSRRFELSHKVDAIIHEQIGDALFDERVIDNIADLRDRLLKPGGRIYPSLLSLYIEPVQLREDMRAPFAWRQQLHGIDFRKIEDFAELSHDYLYRLFRPFPFGHLLAEPEPVVTIDLATATPADLPKSIEYERPVVAEGHFDGYCVYLTASFDDEIWFTTSPEAPATNWANPLLRVDSRRVALGDTIALSLTADDLATPASWRWSG
jgi:type I protein arginine methyltransferase